MIKKLLFHLWNFWPPFWGAGIKIDCISADYKFIRMKLKKRPWTGNYVGTQFGGSMFAMTDPIFMVMLIQHLGRDYIVWDKAASIRYKKPGKTDLFAEFAVTDKEINQIRTKLMSESKMDWEKDVLVRDKSGNIVAEVHKVLHIKKKT